MPTTTCPHGVAGGTSRKRGDKKFKLCQIHLVGYGLGRWWQQVQEIRAPWSNFWRCGVRWRVVKTQYKFWAILCLGKIQQNETTDIVSDPYSLISWSKSEIIFLFGLSINLGLVWSNVIVFILPCRAWLFHKWLKFGNHQIGRKDHIVVNHNLELKKIVVSNKGWLGWAGSARIPRRTDFA